MKLTFGRVMTYITITLFIFFTVVYIIDKIEDKKYRESCPYGINFNDDFSFNIKDSSQVVGAKVYALNRQTGKVLDSTVITGHYNLYYLDKNFSTNYNWKIKLKNGKEILVSDIQTGLGEYRTSFGPTYGCEIKEWKVNGMQYNSEEHPFIIL